MPSLSTLSSAFTARRRHGYGFYLRRPGSVLRARCSMDTSNDPFVSILVFIILTAACFGLMPCAVMQLRSLSRFSPVRGIIQSAPMLIVFRCCISLYKECRSWGFFSLLAIASHSICVRAVLSILCAFMTVIIGYWAIAETSDCYNII